MYIARKAIVEPIPAEGASRVAARVQISIQSDSSESTLKSICQSWGSASLWIRDWMIQLTETIGVVWIFAILFKESGTGGSATITEQKVTSEKQRFTVGSAEFSKVR